jgi:intracellular sulfur oxidation DsrE/DsrF family protein
MLKTLIHVNEPDRWPVAISNIVNLLNDVGDANVSVVVVSNGAGVKGYVTCPEDTQGVCLPGAVDTLKKMEELSKRGVRFLACRNALRANNIEEKSLPPFVEVVPAGMTELIKRQAEGFAYIKP